MLVKGPSASQSAGRIPIVAMHVRTVWTEKLCALGIFWWMVSMIASMPMASTEVTPRASLVERLARYLMVDGAQLTTFQLKTTSLSCAVLGEGAVRDIRSRRAAGSDVAIVSLHKQREGG